MFFIDKHKIGGQVLRIANSSKFDPAGQTIFVNIRNTTSADLIETTDSSDGEDEHSEDIADWRRRAMACAKEKCSSEVLIEVKDTGVAGYCSS